MIRTRTRLAAALSMAAAVALAQRGPATTIPQQLTFAPYHDNGIYDIGESEAKDMTRKGAQ